MGIRIVGGEGLKGTGTMKLLRATILATALMLGGGAGSVTAQELSTESQLLARCQGIYSYGAHLAQMQNNNGLATNLVLRAARVTTANFMLIEENGVIGGKLIRQIEQIISTNKSRLDSLELNIMSELDTCDRQTQSIVSRVVKLRKKLWGLDFWSIQQGMFDKTREVMGLN